MSILKIKAPEVFVNATIKLPSSKSISNRVLILNAMCDMPLPIENLSDSDDTVVLFNSLNSDSNCFDIGAAGTSMRFLTAYLSLKQGEFNITGTERMKHRPIKVLVDALRTLGADVDYVENEGFPPLRIHGHSLCGGKVSLNGGVSSQYISALMMIAPYLDKGMELTLEGEVISKPYILMTKHLMKSFGVEAEWSNNKVVVKPQTYKSLQFKVESDWSAASYWYEILALSDANAEIELLGLDEDSCQGDANGRFLFDKLGVKTEFTDRGVLLTKKPTEIDGYCLEYDFVNEPDLAQTFVVVCCLMNIHFKFSGLQSLKIKETDRMKALQNEMAKLGYLLKEDINNVLSWDGSRVEADANPIIKTYEDHRMAMAFAPACLKLREINIAEPSVVTKSYPKYWDDLQSVGFELKQIKQ
ncbi:3-phosphoshikimate 1-carboxyvinyltransferase [Dysgonomonadaceae bacterium PH5-43]|nr:3-phosphoshikimate 1-carboxyvinyltransferase [Dysgonomonadaceae bacterium PH5-43]